MTFRSGATFSDDMLYRYRLWRRCNENIKPLMFIMLNPSTANEFDNDPTVSRCIELAKRMGYGGIEVCNLYAFRSADPAALYNDLFADLVGPDNHSEIFAASQVCSAIILGWGVHGQKVSNRFSGLERQWPSTVLEIISAHPKVMCLRLNDDGSPKHPLYVGYDVEPVPFSLR